MPNHIKAYIVLLAIGCMCYVLWVGAAKKIEIANYGAGYVAKVGRQYFVAWVVLTSCAFLTSNYYIFALLSFSLIYFLRKKIPIEAQGGLYLVLLLGLPSLSKTIPGFLGLQQLFQSSWPLILGVAFVLAERQGRIFKFTEKVDWAVFLFFAIVGILLLRKSSFTDGLRYVFIYFNLICVPYFIAKKISKNAASVRLIFIGYVFIMLILAGAAVFASLKHWNVYQSLDSALALNERGITGYKYRGGFLRASTTLGAIHLAIASFGAVILYSYLSYGTRSSLYKKAAFFLFFLTIVLTFSRGPWLIGLGVLVLYFAMDRGSKGLIYLVMGLMAFAMLLSVSGVLGSVMDGLSLRDSGNVDYRQHLLEVGVSEIMKYPFFGRLDFRDAAAFKTLIQGEGIVDIVNTYLQIALAYGVIALGFFVYVLIVWPISIYRKAARSKDLQRQKIARAYLCFMLCIAISIFTVSSFNVGSVFFPLIMFWVGVGHGVEGH